MRMTGAAAPAFFCAFVHPMNQNLHPLLHSDTVVLIIGPPIVFSSEHHPVIPRPHT